MSEFNSRGPVHRGGEKLAAGRAQPRRGRYGFGVGEEGSVINWQAAPVWTCTN